MKKLLIIILAAVIYNGCNSRSPENGTEEISFAVEKAPEWTNLMKRYAGWFGGDGIYAIPLDGKEILEEGDTATNLFLFSDTMFGEIKNGELQEGFTMVNNSIALLKGHEPDPSKMDFKALQDSTGVARTLFTPKTTLAEEGEYLWLADGFFNTTDKAVYIFAYRIVNIPAKDIFGFKVVGNILIKIPQGSDYPFEDMEQFDIPFQMGEPSDYFGIGILVNTREANAPHPDGYVYIYGIKDEEKTLVAARVKPEAMTDFSAWRFWDGQNWTKDIGKMAGIVDGISNEISVSPVLKDKYALVFQAGIMTNAVAMRIGETPVGPFSDTLNIWDCAGDLEGSNFFAYNAKAHPSLSKPGELLISYNINSFDFFNDIKEYPNLYRPRFIRVKFR